MRIAFMSLIILLSTYAYSEEKLASLGFSVSVYSGFYYSDLYQATSEISNQCYLNGIIFTGLNIWGNYYIGQDSYLKLNLGANANLVPASDPAWVFVENYTGFEINVLYCYSSIKYFRRLLFGIECGLGIGLAWNHLVNTVWVNGNSENIDIGTIDLISPIEFNYGIIYLTYIPSILKFKNGSMIFNYSHLISFDLGGNFKF